MENYNGGIYSKESNISEQLQNKGYSFGDSLNDTAFIENVCQTEAKYYSEQGQNKIKSDVSQKNNLNIQSNFSGSVLTIPSLKNISCRSSKRLLNKQKLNVLSNSLAKNEENSFCLSPKSRNMLNNSNGNLSKFNVNLECKLQQLENLEENVLADRTKSSLGVKATRNPEKSEKSHLQVQQSINNIILNDVPETSIQRHVLPEDPTIGSKSESCFIMHSKLAKNQSFVNDSIGNVSHSFFKDYSDNNDSSFEITSFLSSQHKLELSSWGLPKIVLKKYIESGITTMFQWQVECLSIPGVLEGQNLVYSAPTSAGKTLVAEIILLKRVLESGKKGIFILPFVSITREKTFSLQKLFGAVGIRVEGFMGGQAPPGGFQRADIAVCTIEKANNVINRLIEEKKVHELGIIVVDELHMVGDSHRGYLLELLLTKLQYLSSIQESCKVQIVGMSATLPNLHVLAMWLKSKLYCTSFRPIPLVEMIKMGKTVYSDKFNVIRELSLHLSVNNDNDHLVQLCLETVIEGYSTLVFCPTKAWCEKIALNVASSFFSIGKPDSKYPLPLVEGIRKRLDGNTLSRVIEALRNCPSGLDPILAKSLAFGAAFHHAGLTFDERDIIEGAFRAGYLPVLIATSTLSSGVNLPARRVIIRSPNSGGKILDSLTYKQMVGRAGRKGKDTLGESILMCNENEKHKAQMLVTAQLPAITSCLFRDFSLTASLKRAILEIVVSGAAKSLEDINRYWNCTLLAASVKDLENNKNNSQNLPASQNSETGEAINPEMTPSSAIDECIKYLFDNELARCLDSREEKQLASTKLGSAILASGLSPDEGLHVFSELQRARKCFVLENELHIIYQVTPVYVSDAWPSLDWMTYLEIWEALPQDMQKVGELVGVLESFIIRSMNGTVNLKVTKQKRSLAIHQRFFAALALHDLVHEVPLSKVVSKYGATKGLLQGLQQSASTFAGMVTIFCNRLGWHSLELLISQYQDRLQFGIQRDLCDLVRITLINGQRARILFNAGLETVGKVAHSSPCAIESILINSTPFQSAKENPNKGAFLLSPTGTPLSIKEAAVIIVNEARQLVEKELGLDFIDWGQVEEKNMSLKDGLNGTTQNKRSRGGRKRSLKKRSRSTSLSNSRKFKYPKLNSDASYNYSDKADSTNVADNVLQAENTINNREQKVDIVMNNNPVTKIFSHDSNKGLIKGDAFGQKGLLRPSSDYKLRKCNEINVDVSPNSLSDCGNVNLKSSLGLNPENDIQEIQQSKESSTIRKISPLAGIDIYKPSTSSEVSPVGSSCSFSKNISMLKSISSAKKSFLFSKSKSVNDQSNTTFAPDSQNKDVLVNNMLKEDGVTSKYRKDSKLKVPSASKDFKSALTTLEKFTPKANRKSLNGSFDDSFDLFAAQVLSNSDLDLEKYPELFENSAVDQKIKREKENKFMFSESDKNKIINIIKDEDAVKLEVRSVNLNNRSSVSDDFFNMSDDFDVKESTPKPDQMALCNKEKDLLRTPLYSALCEELKFEYELPKTSDTIIKSTVKKSHRRISFSRGSCCDIVNLEVKEANCSLDCVSNNTSDENVLISESGVLSMTRSNIEEDLNEFEMAVVESSKNNLSETESFADSFFEGALDSNFLSEKGKSLSDQKIAEGKQNHSSLRRSSRRLGMSFNDFSSLNLTPGMEERLHRQVYNKLTPKVVFPAGKPTPEPTIRNMDSQQENLLETILIGRLRESERAVNTSLNDHMKTMIHDLSNNDSALEPTGELSIIDVTSDDELFRVFLNEWQSQREFAISLACENVESLPHREGIGWKVCGRSRSKRISAQKSVSGLVIDKSKMLLTGLSICWGDTYSYFINLKTTNEENLSKEKLFLTPPVSKRVSIEERIEGIKSNINNSKDKVIRCWNVKTTIKLLVLSGLGLIKGGIEDPRVASWMLDPTAKEKNIHNLVLSHCDHLHPLLDVIGSSDGYESLGISNSNGKSSRLGSALESVLVYQLCEFMRKSLKQAEMGTSWTEIEMPSIMIMSLLELTGIGFSSSQCDDQRRIMEEKRSLLQQEAFQLAGHPFSLSSPADVAKVLYRELHITPPLEASSISNQVRRGTTVRNTRVKGGPTNKEALEKIQDKHPLPGVILEWRRIHHALTKFVIPLTAEKVFCSSLSMDRIFPVAHTFTATGRISFQDPNLQNINKDFEIKLPKNYLKTNPAASRSLPLAMQHLAPLLDKSLPEEHTVSLRHAIIAGSNRLLLAADYSQLELRLLAHLSGDEKLLKALNSDKDVFKSIASQLNRIPIGDITTEMRQQAKQVSYGLIYGMGEKSLGHQLNLSEEEASRFIAKFRLRFPQVQQFLQSCVFNAQEKGYVVTMKNRRRYLQGLTSSAAYTKSQCERQAINTQIQGSAADLVKMAMISIDKNLKENFPDAANILSQSSHNQKSISGAYLVLQLHDELIYEVASEDIIQVAQIVKHQMEGVCKLSVRLPVQLKVGPSWGTMKPFSL